MSEKKHIDRLFQEKLKDFEAKPSADVWEGIQSKMETPQEEPKTVFPLWLRFAGIAAALVLLLTIGNFAFNKENTENNNTVVETKSDTESVNSATENKISNNASNTNGINETVTVSRENKNLSKENNQSIKSTNNTIQNTTIVSNNNDSKNSINSTKTLKNDNDNLNSQVSNSNTVAINKTLNANAAVANQNNKNTNKTVSSNNTNEESTLIANQNTKNDAVRNSKEKTNTAVTKNSILNRASANTNSLVNNSKNTVLNNNNLSNNKVADNSITNNTSKNSNTNTVNNTPNTKAVTVLDNNNDAISNTAIATTNSEKEKEEEKMMDPDSANSSNTIEEALAKIENLDEEEEILNRWSVNANIAPVYYNTLGKGSHIHEQFVDNPKNGEVNTSYGINVGYALNKRLKVRSGIHKLNLSYDTANVIVYENVTSTPSSSPLRNINFVPTNDGQNISVLSSNSFAVQQIDGFINNDLNAALSQRLSYVEVPLELEYTVVKKRFGINLIGGFSTFILNDNEVVTEVDNRKTKIGEANNINTMSFSANAGIGIDYKFNKALKFNLEPTFKYQINAYSETSGDFRPYIIGVYTGISYKF